MKKPTFKNNHASGIGKPMRFLRKTCFLISSLGSAICIAFALVGYLSPDVQNAGLAIWITAITLSFIAASTVDFSIIDRLGRFSFSEIIAWITGDFEVSLLRKIASVMVAAFVVGGIYVSFITSFYGAQIAASMAPNIKPSTDLTNTVKLERDAVKNAVLPYEKALHGVESKMKKEMDARTASFMGLAQKGNAWAKNEVLRIEQEIYKKHEKELTAAKNDLSKAKQREQFNSDVVIAAVTTETEQTVFANKSKQSGITVLLSAMGVFPLLAGVLLLIIECIGSVSLQLPPPAEKTQSVSNNSNAGPRTDNGLESMFSNP